MVIFTQVDVFSVFCKTLLSRIRFEISVVCNAMQDIPRSTKNKMFRNLKGEGTKILKLQIDLSCEMGH